MEDPVFPNGQDGALLVYKTFTTSRVDELREFALSCGIAGPAYDTDSILS